MNELPEGFQRVARALSALRHPHSPVLLPSAARTSQEAADALGIGVGQIAKSVVFRLSPQQLEAMTGAPVADVVVAP